MIILTSIFLFGNQNTIIMNIKNMEISLMRMTNFIKNRNLKNEKIDNILYIAGFGQATWTSISAIYESGWDMLKNSKDNIIFCQKVKSRFSNNIPTHTNGKKSKRASVLKSAEISKLPPLLVLPRPIKKKLNKSKFYGENGNKHQGQSENGTKRSLIYKHHLPTLRTSSKLRSLF